MTRLQSLGEKRSKPILLVLVLVLVLENCEKSRTRTNRQQPFFTQALQPVSTPVCKATLKRREPRSQIGALPAPAPADAGKEGVPKNPPCHPAISWYDACPFMKTAIHPKYLDAEIRCACGNVIKTRSTRSTIIVGICNVCHPFYTGQQKFVDTAGRVDKFQQRLAKTQAAQAEHATKKKKKV
jgi:large subunit ribosomal protein L31